MDFGLILYAVIWILTGVKPDRETLEINWNRFELLDAPLLKTIELVIPALIIGGIMAVAVALMRLSKNLPLRLVSSAYVQTFRGTPLLIQIFLIYYGLGQFNEFWRSIGLWDGFFAEAYWCAVLALALNTTAYTSEIVRGGILSVPHGQIEAARAIGMSRLLLFRRITMPIAIRQAMPAYSNEAILMVKGTALASIITVMEITGITKSFIASTFAPIEGFLAAGSLYLLINFTLTRVFLRLEKRMNVHLQPRVVASSPTAVAAAE